MRYAPASKRRVASQNFQVKSGHMVGTRPAESWYQLEHQPTSQTDFRTRRWRAAS